MVLLHYYSEIYFKMNIQFSKSVCINSNKCFIFSFKLHKLSVQISLQAQKFPIHLTDAFMQQQALCLLCVCWLTTFISTSQNLTALCNLFAGGGINFHMFYKPCKATFLCFDALGKTHLVCKDGFIYQCFQEERMYLEQK